MKYVFIIVFFTIGCGVLPRANFWEKQSYKKKCLNLKFDFFENALGERRKLTGQAAKDSEQSLKSLLKLQNLEIDNSKEQVRVEITSEAPGVMDILHLGLTTLSLGLIPYSSEIEHEISIYRGEKLVETRSYKSKSVSSIYRLNDFYEWDKKSYELYGAKTAKASQLKEVSEALHHAFKDTSEFQCEFARMF